MKKLQLICIVLCICFVLPVLSGFSQVNLNQVYEKYKNKQRKAVPMENLREADIMWAKVVWRQVNLKERMNLPLYLPHQKMYNRTSLADLLIKAVENEGLMVYKPNTSDNEFIEPMKMSDIKERFDAQPRTMFQVDEDGNPIEVTIPGEIRTSEVEELLVKELWFYDRQRSVMEVRVIGFCPIRTYYKDEDIDKLEPKKRQLFWVYYPQVRDLLAKTSVFNPYSDAENMTFDDVFTKRFFSGYIVRESNVYDNRYINEYAGGIGSLMEAEQIKSDIANFEHDMWEY